MRKRKKIIFGLMALLCLSSTIQAQKNSENLPLDGIYVSTVDQRLPLKHPTVREADVFWEKRVWRTVELREKMNLPFMNPDEPFVNLLFEAIRTEELTVYSAENDNFSVPMDSDEITRKLSGLDTVRIVDPLTQEPTLRVVDNPIYYEDIKRFRIKEVWYFDENTSTMKVRILGIAPMLAEYDEDTGAFLYETPMFWVYYPDARGLLSKHKAPNNANDASPMTWEDIFEMRMFASRITKVSNIQGNRIEDYKTGIDRLIESKRLSDELFDFEQDLWSY